jgi:hypothetical protein
MSVGAGLLGNIDIFESIKGGPGGVEATIRRAEAATGLLQHLAETLAEVIVQQMFMARFMGGAVAEDRDRQKALILDALRVVGLDAASIARVEAADRQAVLIEYSNGINRHAAPHRDSPQRPAYDAFWLPFRDGLTRPIPAELRAVVSLAGPPEEWRDELLKDYSHYVAVGSQRRPDVWAQRDKWYGWVAAGAPWAPDAIREG